MCRDSCRGSRTRWTGVERIVHPPRRDLRYRETMHAGAEGRELCIRRGGTSDTPGPCMQGGGRSIVHPPRRGLRYTGTMHAGAEGARHSSSGAITHPREGRAFAGIY